MRLDLGVGSGLCGDGEEVVGMVSCEMGKYESKIMKDFEDIFNYGCQMMFDSLQDCQMFLALSLLMFLA